MDWRFEDGEIRGRKLIPTHDEVLDVEDVDPKTLAPKIRGQVVTSSINKSIRADRDRNEGLLGHFSTGKIRGCGKHR